METSHQNKSTEITNAEVPTSSQHFGNALLPDALMATRYKVIADYPFCSCNIGDIIPCYESAVFWGIECNDTSGKVYMSDYPHLFKKLEWWEERKVEEMPEYVKDAKTNYCYKVLPPEFNGRIWHDDFEIEMISLQRFGSFFLPITEAEYMSYIEGLKK